MSITTLLDDWLKCPRYSQYSQYSCDIHKHLNTCLGIVENASQPPTKQPCLSIHIVLEWAGSGNILATHTFNKQIEIHEALHIL